MALSTTNGMSFDDLTGLPSGPGLVKQLGDQVDEFYGKSAANIAALPAAGHFPGQRIYLVDAEGWAVWTGTSWRSDTPWVNIGTAGSGSSYGSGWAAGTRPMRARVRDGRLEVDGVCTNSSWTSPSVAFILPTNMRPDREVVLGDYLMCAPNTGVVSAYGSYGSTEPTITLYGTPVAMK